MTAALKVGAQRLEVVHFPVAHNAHGAIFVEDGLMPTGHVDYTEPPVPDGCMREPCTTFIIRAPVLEQIAHAPQQLIRISGQRAQGVGFSADSTHARSHPRIQR
jgi:hypothetical protein